MDTKTPFLWKFIPERRHHAADNQFKFEYLENKISHRLSILAVMSVQNNNAVVCQVHSYVSPLLRKIPCSFVLLKDKTVCGDSWERWTGLVYTNSSWNQPVGFNKTRLCFCFNIYLPVPFKHSCAVTRVFLSEFCSILHL